MKIISVGNIKGGTGKTTTSINVAAELAKQGYKTLLIDNDAQCNITQILLHDECPEVTLYDVYSDKQIGLDDCIYELDKNFYMIPNSIKSCKLEMELYNRMNRERVLELKKNTIPDIFDFVIIDNSPFLGLIFQNALTLSDYYIPVIDNSSSSLQGLNMINDIVNELVEEGLNSKIQLLGVLRNRFDKQTSFTKDFNEVLETTLTTKIFNTIIYNSIKYKECLALHQPIQKHNKELAKPYYYLINEIIERIEDRQDGKKNKL